MVFFNSFNIKNKTEGVASTLCSSEVFYVFVNLTNKQHWFSITRAQAEQGTGDLQEVLPPWLSAYKYKISNTNTISIKRKYNELGVSSEFGRSDQFGGDANVPKSSFLTIVHPTFFHFLSHSVFFRLHCNALTSLICSSEI